MTDPSPYVVNYSFSGFQANSPTTPLPGPKLDAELAGAATAIASVIAALQDIRRADGTLQNGIVTFDSFESGLQLLLDPTNGQLVAAAVAVAQAAAVSASGFNSSAGVHDASAAAFAAAAAASAGTVNLALYLAKANNLAGLGSVVTSRANLGLGSVATLDVGPNPLNVMQLDESGRVPPYNGSQIANIDVLMVGAILWVASATPLPGTLKVNGSLLSRATFARLYTHAASANIVSEASWFAGFSASFSTGDLTTTFRLPDIRGEFIRGWDDARGVDAGRSPGTNQAESLKNHTHTYNQFALPGGTGIQTGTGLTNSNTAVASGSPSTGAASETRPRNVAMMACIKY